MPKLHFLIVALFSSGNKDHLNKCVGKNYVHATASSYNIKTLAWKSIARTHEYWVQLTISHEVGLPWNFTRPPGIITEIRVWITHVILIRISHLSISYGFRTICGMNVHACKEKSWLSQCIRYIQPIGTQPRPLRSHTSHPSIESNRRCWPHCISGSPNMTHDCTYKLSFSRIECTSGKNYN